MQAGIQRLEQSIVVASRVKNSYDFDACCHTPKIDYVVPKDMAPESSARDQWSHTSDIRMFVEEAAAIS